MLVTTIRKSSNAFGSSQSWVEQLSTCLEVDTMSPHKELVTLLLSKHAHVMFFSQLRVVRMIYSPAPATHFLDAYRSRDL